MIIYVEAVEDKQAIRVEETKSPNVSIVNRVGEYTILTPRQVAAILPHLRKFLSEVNIGK